MYGGDSKYLIFQKNWNEYWGLYVCILVFLTLIPYWLYNFIIHFSFIVSLASSLVIAILSIILFAIINGFKIDALKYKIGIYGESQIRTELLKLPDEYSVYQDAKILSRKENIDFVVIGPTGIFTIEVKSWGGRINYDGEVLTFKGRKDSRGILHQAKGEAQFLNHFLKEQLKVEIGFIHPIIVFAGNANIHFGLNPIEEAYIVQKSYLLEVLIKRNSGYFDPKNRVLIENKIAELINHK